MGHWLRRGAVLSSSEWRYFRWNRRFADGRPHLNSTRAGQVSRKATYLSPKVTSDATFDVETDKFVMAARSGVWCDSGSRNCLRSRRRAHPRFNATSFGSRARLDPCSSSIVYHKRSAVKLLPKVFVVDDDLAALKSLSTVLNGRGFRVRCFDSANEFMAQLLPTQVGCAVVSLSVPDLLGSQLLRRLCESGSLLSVILISGPHDSMGPEGQESESVQILETPYDVSMLLTMVDQSVGSSLRRRVE